MPVDPDGAEVGVTALGCMPYMAQLFVSAPAGNIGGIDLDRRVYPLRKRAERNGVYFPSLSSRTMVYKGMLTTMQLPQYFPDLRDERCVSAIAIVHSRFSTNTFPSWPLAHPFRFVAHNGEINTVRGNRNRMHAREAMLASSKIPGDLSRLSPICTPEASDSASFDEVLELLHLGGRSLHHAVLMMIPEAWENNSTMDSAERAFWQFHASLMEPWDGPACVTFTDGTLVGAVLDRNGLRPGRWWRTIDDRVILASESGVLDVPSAEIVAKGRLQPGKMFLIDTAQGRIVSDDEIKEDLSKQEPYGELLHAGLLDLKTLPDRVRVQPNHESVVRRQISFGYTEEDLRILLTPMAASGAEPLGSMGTDTPTAVLSQRSRLLYDYFVELFAQVTNPPLDAIREEVVTSMARVMGPEQNLLEPTAASCRQIVLRWPVLDNDELNKIVHINDDRDHPGLKTAVLKALYDVERGAEGLADALEDLRQRACDAIAKGARTLVISDRDSDHTRAPIPSLLAVSAVHHHLVRTKERTTVALVVESGDAREVHHIAMLIGFGAAAVNPYLAFESIEDLIREGELTGIEPAAAVRNYLKALGKGVMKVMSKMGISTVASYTAAQAFEAVGINQDVIDEYFTGTPTQLGGAGLDVIAEEVKHRHRRAYPENPTERVHRRLEVGGEYAFRREGELHLFTPEVVFLLQHSTRTGRHEVFGQYSDEVNRLSKEGGTLRGLFEFKKGLRPPVPLEEVEPVESIVTRFNTGAMSYGSISAEAHETMAIAMNNLGGRSNSGEGGEDVDRLYDPKRRSAVKQVASGRFGVTSDYLVNATDIQIKMAQGAKPGEGGQLPGFKVYPNIAKTRHSTPGVGLISPPPHHDIYSIEDLAQLIHDLKNANPDARIHVKLVSSVGVGTVAAGVSKAHADVVLISGHDGGTGAAPLTSLKHAGVPWEIGLADTQQTLVLNGLRDRITVQCDGGMRTARDVIVAALLGAEEYGFATAPLVVSGCIMMRVCHLDTCPVGVATQNPELRARFNGKPEFVENFFRFIAEDIRRLSGRARVPQHRRGRRPRRGARHRHGRRPLEEPGPRPDPGFRGAQGCGATATRKRPGPRPGSSAGPHADPARRGRTRGCASGATGTARAQRQPHRRHPARLRGHPPLRRAGPARRHHPRHADRLGGPVHRRVPAARYHPRADRRRQRLCRQRPFGWPRHRPAARRRAVPAGGQRDRRQHIAVRRHLRRGLPARPGGGAVRRAQLRRADRRRGRRRPRLRIHDQWPGRRARKDRPQHGGRHVRRHRIRARPRPRQGQHRNGRAAAPRARGPDLAARRHRQARRLHRQHRGHLGAVRLAKAQRAIHQDHAPRLPARAGGHPVAKREGRDVDTAIMEASRG